MRIRWIKKERKERGGEGKEEEEINSRGKTRIELGSTRLGGVFKLASDSVPTKLISFLDSRDSSEG